MESSTIALGIRYFNIALIVAMAAFAICGLIVILGRSSRLNVFRSRMFLSAFCVASLLALALEAVCFNYKHYIKYFAGDEFVFTKVSSEEIAFSDSTVYPEMSIFNNNGNLIVNSITFKNVNRRVTSVFVQPTFNNLEQMEARIRWTDEESTREMTKKFYKALPHENHTAVQTCGNASEITIMFPRQPIIDEISQIAVNRQIPIYFSGLRLLVVSSLFFAIILFVYKPLREKTRYYLFEYTFDPANRKQNLVYAGLVVLTIGFSGICVYTSSGIVIEPAINDTYNKYLVDAFIARQINIDWGHPEKLLNAERPYDWYWKLSNDYKYGVDWVADISWYKGKYYTYYGVVPAVLLYIPYKLITGNYLSHYAGVFVFTAIAVVLMALLWRFLVIKYMPTARFVFYLLSFLALFFVSRLSTCVRFPTIYSIAQVSAFAFVVAGTFLLLKSVDKENINRLQLFIACLCLALAVGCRPNMFLVSILVPAVLWKRKSWKLAMFISIPYIMVAIPLCAYNYVRFESIFEFGQKYCMAIANLTAFNLLNPLGKIHRAFTTFIFYLFRPYNYSLHFPFVEYVLPAGPVASQFGFVWCHNGGGGLINYPILFYSLYWIKNIFNKDKPDGFQLLSIFFTIAVIMIALYSILGTFHGRYLLDCAIFFICPSLFCAYYFCGEVAYLSAPRLKFVYISLTMSIFIGLFLLVSGYDNLDLGYFDPALRRYLEYSLGIIERF